MYVRRIEGGSGMSGATLYDVILLLIVLNEYLEYFDNDYDRNSNHNCNSNDDNNLLN